MSFLSQLQAKLDKGLKPTTTKTTFPDGTVQLSSSSGVTSERKFETFGFVVDEKPDLTVGIIQPNLLISSQDVPNDENLVREHGITHILSLLPGFVLHQNVKPLIRGHLVLEIYDEESFKLDSNIFTEAFRFIRDAQESQGIVLIHCNAGLSRAPSVAIAYLMNQEKLSFEEAWEKVQRARPSMKPNTGFVRQLKELESQ